MGVGMVALAFTAVYRGASSSSRDQVPPPASTGLEQDSKAAPSTFTEHSPAPLSVIPHTP
jgi:hypothetical protein